MRSSVVRVHDAHWNGVVVHQAISCLTLTGVYTRDVPLAKNPSTGTAQQRLFLVLKVVLHAVVVISEVLRLSTKSRCSRCCRHISSVHLQDKQQAPQLHKIVISNNSQCFKS